VGGHRSVGQPNDSCRGIPGSGLDNREESIVNNREETTEGLLKNAAFASIKKLYRYRSMESLELEGIFNNRQIYLPRPIDFNAPFECRPRIIPLSRLKRQFYLMQRAKILLPFASRNDRRQMVRKGMSEPQLFEKAYDQLLITTIIYCLSEKNDEILIWSHYADGHKGVCLEFDAFSDAAFSEMILFGDALKVYYSDTRPTINLLDIGDKPEEYKNAFLTKSTHWGYEQEWRIIRVEHQGGFGPRHFQPEILTGVIFGAFIAKQDKQKILELIKNYPTKINLYQSKINERRYQLDIEPA
jgi:hypothetical protein